MDNGQSSKLTRRDRVAELLRNEIATGQLAPGEILRDAELAERYGTSTSPVREALLLLASESLIEMPPNNAKRVAPLDKETTENLFSIFELLANHGMKTGLANFDFARVNELRDAYAELNRKVAAGDLSASIEAAYAFFFPIFESANNPQLIRLMQICVVWLGRLSFLVYSFDRATGVWVTVCSEVLEAIENDDAGQAIEAFGRFISEERKHVSTLPLL